MPDITDTSMTQGAQLDSAPPRPPRSRQSRSIMDLSTSTDENAGLGMEAQNPIVQIMSAMGAARNSLMLLSAQLPVLTPGIQQFIAGLEQTIPQLLADISTGQAPGMGQAAAPMSNQAPTAPPAAAGLP